MGLNALGRKSLVCIATLLALAVPVIFTACAGGLISPASGSKQSSSVALDSVLPNTAPPTGGTTVVINGANFSSPTQSTLPSVTFGGVAAIQVSMISPLQLRAVVPSHTSGTVSVRVTNPDGTSATLANGFTYGSTTFSLNSVSPISGPANGGTTITISGSNFQSGASVTLGGLAASSVTVSNSTTIQAATPTHSSGPVTVVVTNPNGHSATLPSGFTFHSVNLVWSAPASSPVTITGYNVYRALSSAGPFSRLNGSTTIADTSFNDGSVQGATTYFYEVRSVGSNGTESAAEGPAQTTVGP